MKNVYPNYKQNPNRIKGKRISKYEKIEKELSPKNRKIIYEFLEYCMINSKSEVARGIRKRTMLQIYNIMEKPLSSLTLKDLRDFLIVLNNSILSPATQNDIKTLFKRFLRWYYKDWSERFDNFIDVKMKDERNHKKINPTTLLTSEEIERLHTKSESLKYKALILLMYESGGRPEEILKLKWRDIDLVNKRVKLDSGKTGKTRVNEIESAIPRLEAHKQEYPFPNVKDYDLVFPTPRDRDKQMTTSALSSYLNYLGKRADIKKHVWPYLLRHTRLTPLIQKLSPKAYVAFAGHALETGMYYYGHLSHEEINKEIREKVYADSINLLPEEVNEMKSKMQEMEKEIIAIKRLILNGSNFDRDMYITQNTQGVGALI